MSKVHLGQETPQGQERDLEERSKEELIAIIREMIRRAPELELVLELPLPTAKNLGQPVNADMFRRQAASAFQIPQYRWGIEKEIARELSRTLDLAYDYLSAGNPANAAVIFKVVCDEVLEHFAQFHDESGALRETVAICVDGLGQCLATAPNNEALRGTIIRALFEAYRLDVDFGGVGMSDRVPELILENTDPAERKQVTSWVQEALAQLSTQETITYYRHQTFGGFLLQLQVDELDDEHFIRLCREAHRLNDLVERLLQLGRVAEASQVAVEARDYDLLNLADVFVRYGKAETAERLMGERGANTKDSRIGEWLQKYWQARGDNEAALHWARHVFGLGPSLEQYRLIRELAKVLGRWETVRSELLADLREQQAFDWLTQIYLDDSELDEALACLPQVQYSHESLSLQVAQATMSSHPREAREIYLQLAEKIIGRRDRGNYALACQHLLHARTIYHGLGETASWNQYLGKLKAGAKSLRALKAEMAKAGL